MGQCVSGSNTAFLHTWAQRWNSGSRGVAGVEISPSISEAQSPKRALGGNRKRSQLAFQAFRSQVTS